MLEAMRHDRKASCLVGELRSIVGPMGDEHPSENFATVDDNLGVFLSKEVE